MIVDKKHLKIKGVGKGTYEGEWKNDFPHGYGVYFFIIFILHAKKYIILVRGKYI